MDVSGGVQNEGLNLPGQFVHPERLIFVFFDAIGNPLLSGSKSRTRDPDARHAVTRWRGVRSRPLGYTAGEELLAGHDPTRLTRPPRVVLGARSPGSARELCGG